MKDKTAPKSFSLPERVIKALQAHAKKATNGNESAVVQAALTRYLTDSGELTVSSEERAQDALARLMETEGAEKAAEIIEGVLAAYAGN